MRCRTCGDVSAGSRTMNARENAAMCAVCPRRVDSICGRTLEPVVGIRVCAEGRHTTVDDRRTRWLGVRWRGVPRPVRWWLGAWWAAPARWLLRDLAGQRPMPRLLRHTTLPECGCVDRLKSWWESWWWGSGQRPSGAKPQRSITPAWPAASRGRSRRRAG